MTALMGVAIAGILILMMLGFQEALFNSSVSFIEKLDADLVLLNRQSVSLINLASFPEERMSEVRDNPAVKDVANVRWRYSKWRFRGDQDSYLAIAVGVNPSQKVFSDPEINRQQPLLNLDSRILFDSLSRPEYGPVVKEFKAGKNVFAYANELKLRIVGLVQFGTSFGYEGSFLTSISTVNQIVGGPAGSIELGVIRLIEGADPSKVIQEVSPFLSEDVFLMTKSNFESLEKQYWNRSKPIGFVFAFCVVMGLGVGAMMVYQVLHTDVTFHLPAYAVLLSIGYSRSKLEKVVFFEAMMLTFLGFPLAWLISSGLFYFTRIVTGLPMEMSSEIVLYTFLLTLAMCTASALLAMAKLEEADPANLFG